MYNQKTIGTYRDIEIYYNETEDRFEAKLDEETKRVNIKLSGIKKSIDRFLDEDAKAKKQTQVPAILLEDNSLKNRFRNVVITSFYIEATNYDNERNIIARIKPLVATRYEKAWEFVGSYNMSNLFQTTDENKIKIEKIENLKEQKKEIDKEIEKIIKGLKAIVKPKKTGLPIKDN